MMEDRKGCLTAEAAAAWIDGGASAPERAAWAGHLDSCDACRERLSALLGDGETGVSLDPGAVGAAVAGVLSVLPVRPAPRRTAFTGAWRFAAAASVLLAAGWLFFRSGDAPARRFTLPEGRRVEDAPQALAGGADRPEAFTLPDGSRARFAPGARARLLSPGPGERVVVDLASGGIEVEAVKDPRAFRVMSEAGEVRVVGTSFMAKAFRIRQETGDRRQEPEERTVRGELVEPRTPVLRQAQDERVLAVLSVEVAEGVVDLTAGGRTLRIPAGKRGILRAGSAPLLQEMAPWDWKTAVARLAAGWERPGFAGSVEAATLLAGTWEGGGGDWRARASDPAAPARERRIAKFLAGLLEDPE